MPLDHKASAEELEHVARTMTNMAVKIGTTGAFKEAADCRERLLGLAEWHEDQAKEQLRQENIYQLSKLHQSADQALTQTH